MPFLLLLFQSALLELLYAIRTNSNTTRLEIPNTITRLGRKTLVWVSEAATLKEKFLDPQFGRLLFDTFWFGPSGPQGIAWWREAGTGVHSGSSKG